MFQTICSCFRPTYKNRILDFLGVAATPPSTTKSSRKWPYVVERCLDYNVRLKNTENMPSTGQKAFGCIVSILVANPDFGCISKIFYVQGPYNKKSEKIKLQNFCTRACFRPFAVVLDQLTKIEFWTFWAWPPRPHRPRNRPENDRTWCRDVLTTMSVLKTLKICLQLAKKLLVASSQFWLQIQILVANFKCSMSQSPL